MTLSTGEVFYLVRGLLVAAAFTALIVITGSLTPKEIRVRRALAREGKTTLTNDVHVGGMRSATVFYTFAYGGQTYTGEAYLPSQYLDKVLNYSKTGNFPVLFAASDPSSTIPSIGMILIRVRSCSISLSSLSLCSAM